jgi:hypothetical protein
MLHNAVTVSSVSLICSPSLQEFYMSMMSNWQSGATGNGTSEIAQKRRKINQNAAVITHENFTDAVAEIKNMRVTGKRHCHSQQIKINPVIRHEKISSSEGSDSCQPEEKNTRKSGDFVVVKLVPKGKKIKPAYYVGYVSKVVGENYTIQSLLRYSSSSCHEFIFPG